MPYISSVCVIVYVIGHALGPSMYPLAGFMVSVTHILILLDTLSAFREDEYDPKWHLPRSFWHRMGGAVISTMG